MLPFEYWKYYEKRVHPHPSVMSAKTVFIGDVSINFYIKVQTACKLIVMCTLRNLQYFHILYSVPYS